MKREYLSDIELYYANNSNSTTLELTGDELKHAIKIMRHAVGDKLHATDGLGNYFESTILAINKNSLSAEIQKREKYSNELENIYFCFPRLKNNSRFEFELEKSVELGITNFIIFHSERTIPKGEKLERWNKIALSAMKQSLRTYLPKIEYVNSFEKIVSLNGIKLIFDQKSNTNILSYLTGNKKKYEREFFVFGPEGGLSKKELSNFDKSTTLSLIQNRLRAETAVVATAAMVSLSRTNKF